MKTLGLHDEITIIYQVSGEKDPRNLYFATLLHYKDIVCTAEGRTVEETLKALVDIARVEGYDLTV